MRIRWTDLLLVAAIAVAVPGAARAEDENLRHEMDEMRNMIMQLQDTVQAQSGQIEQQREVIDRAGIQDVKLGEGSESGISSFFQDIEVNGWLTFTYFINANDPRNSIMPFGGSNIPVTQAGTDDNSFTFQQLWFEFGKPATKESRAGFFAEMAFGRDACTLGNCGGFGGGDNLYINSAYIEYLASFGDFDVTFKAGKFGTLIGYEVAQAPYNFNITRGNVYNLLQPISHVGMLASTEFGDGFDVTLGVVNNPDVYWLDTTQFSLAKQVDSNDNKTFIGHVGYTADKWSLSLNGLHGDDTARTEQPRVSIIDLIATLQPIEGLTLVMNADYLLRGDSNGVNNGTLDDSNANAWGIALTANYDWTEKLATALRYEFVDDDGNVWDCNNFNGVGLTPPLVEDECQIHSLTGTVAYKLTDDLKVRGEIRYDAADLKGKSDNSVYNGHRGSASDDDQLLFGFEALYEF